MPKYVLIIGGGSDSLSSNALQKLWRTIADVMVMLNQRKDNPTIIFPDSGIVLMPADTVGDIIVDSMRVNMDNPFDTLERLCVSRDFFEYKELNEPPERSAMSPSSSYSRSHGNRGQKASRLKYSKITSVNNPIRIRNVGRP